MDSQLIGKKIKERRKALHMSQEQFAERIDRSTNFVSNLENGKKGASIESIIAVCQVLNISADDLLIGKTSPREDPFLDELEQVFSNSTRNEKRFLIDAVVYLKYLLDLYLAG